MTEQMFTLGARQKKVIGVLSALLLATVAWAAYRALTKSPMDAFVLGFEGVLALCGLTGLLLVWGRFRDGPGLALALIALAVVVCTGLGLVSQQFAARQVARSPWFLGRFALALGFAGVGAWTVLARDGRSAKAARQGVIWLGLGLVMVAGVAVAWKVWTPQGTAMKVGAITALMVAGVALVAFISVGVDLVIQAFEYGRLDRQATSVPGSPAPMPKSPAGAGQEPSGSTT